MNAHTDDNVILDADMVVRHHVDALRFAWWFGTPKPAEAMREIHNAMLRGAWLKRAELRGEA